MITVNRLIQELKTYPKDALVYAYEGEDVGIGILIPPSKKDRATKEYAFIRAHPSNSVEADEALLIPIQPKKKTTRKKRP